MTFRFEYIRKADGSSRFTGKKADSKPDYYPRRQKKAA